MLKIIHLVSILVLISNCIYAQLDSKNSLSIEIAGPETENVFGFNDSSNLNFTAILFKAKYTRLFKIGNKLSIGPSLSFQQNLTKLKLSTKGFGTDILWDGDYHGWGIGMNTFLPLKKFKENNYLILNVSADYVLIAPELITLGQIFYPSDSVTYQNFMQIDHNDIHKKFNGTIALMYNIHKKRFEYNFSLGLTGVFPDMRESWFVFYRRHFDEEVKENNYRKMKFIHPVFSFTWGF